MKRLILVEGLKVFAYRTFWIFITGYIGIFFLSSSVINGIAAKVQFGSVAPGSAPLFMFPQTWQTLGYIGGLLFFLPGCIVILLMSNEFENRTLRQHIIEGLGREAYLSGKFLFILFLSFFACIVFFTLSLMFGTAPPEGGIFSVFTLIYMGLLFLKGVGILCFALMVSVFIKRAMLSTFVFISYPIFIEPLAGWILDHRVANGISKMLPMQVLFSYIPSPFFTASAGSGLPSLNLVLSGTLYTSLFFFITWFVFRHMDL